MIKAIHSIETGLFKLDGGAMFGVVPKSMWKKLNPPDDNNLCTWAMRCLLIETEDRLILVDTGMGDKQDERFKSFFHPHGDMSLSDSLRLKGFQTGDITDVLLTHLHFDHCGAAVEYNDSGELVPGFPNARYWSNERHWDWAMNPNEREKASFLKENFVPLLDHRVLQFVDSDKSTLEWLPGINLRFVNGHTEAMMLVQVELDGNRYIYCADLFPSSHHVAMPYIMAYDVRPLVTLQEKEIILNQAVEQRHILIFEHDPKIEAAVLKRDDKGRIVVDKAVTI